MEKKTQGQHIFVSGVIAIIGLWVCWLSYTREPGEAYLFARLVSSLFVILALWTFVKALIGRSRVGAGFDKSMLKNMAPGIFVSFVYLFWAAKNLGFYVASLICVLVLIALYDPSSHKSPSIWLKRILIALIFTGVMYLMFSLFLKVYIP
ncbi:MAG: tripartite tricarboxylate transporter TctB family protein, partial [Pseudomonadota bacterium]